MSFSDLNLHPLVLKSIQEKGYENPTAIQKQAIPKILEGKDIIATSQTGTGKTAAFALPILTRYFPQKKPQCLILEPTRELAQQVADAFDDYGKFTKHQIAILYGGTSLEKQKRKLFRPLDIIVATPGRLLDHLKRKNVSLATISTLVLDEADRMMDMGFLPDIEKIFKYCTAKNRQTILFSATIPAQIERIAEKNQKNAEKILISADNKIAKTINHFLYPVPSSQRKKLFIQLIDKIKDSSALIFTRTRRDTETLESLLQKNGNKSVILHAGIRQEKRTRSLKKFKNGEVNFLIATDVASRGLDISQVGYVINFSVPENSEDYIHRIGRTGRAEKSGEAFTLFDSSEERKIRSIEKLIGTKIERKKLEGFDYQFTASPDKKRKPYKKRPAQRNNRKRWQKKSE